MIAAIKEKEPDANICISYNGPTFYPNMDNVKEICRFPKIASRLAQLDFFLILMTKGKLSVTKEGRGFINEVKKRTSFFTHREDLLSEIFMKNPNGYTLKDFN